jgi:hypothetical protein
VLVTLRQSAQLRGSGSRVEAVIHHLWQLDHGKVLEAWTYAERAEALDAVGLLEQD